MNNFILNIYGITTKIIGGIILYYTIIGLSTEALDYDYSGWFHIHTFDLLIAALTLVAIPYIYKFIIIICDLVKGKKNA